MIANIHEQARGRWNDILTEIGVSPRLLDGKHHPCLFCGGTDRFRFDDREGRGTYICSHCGAGTGVDLVMKFLKLDFRGAKEKILTILPSAKVSIRPATSRQSVESLRDWLGNVWSGGYRLSGNDPASRYLQSRGIAVEQWPSQLRFVSRFVYKHDDGSKTHHPVMLAKFVSPDATQWTLHCTYLTPAGQKADLPKVRKLLPLPVPTGGCVRLCKSAEVMGVAEGIETALSASLLHGMPVWATLSAGALIKWQPPATAKTVVIFADNDVSYTGQMAAYSLAYNLRGQGVGVEVVMPPACGADWNDILQQGRAA